MLCSSVFVVLLILLANPVPGRTRALHTPDKAMQVGFLSASTCICKVLNSDSNIFSCVNNAGHRTVPRALQWPFNPWWPWKSHKWPIRRARADLQLWAKGCRISQMDWHTGAERECLAPPLERGFGQSEASSTGSVAEGVEPRLFWLETGPDRLYEWPRLLTTNSEIYIKWLLSCLEYKTLCWSSLGPCENSVQSCRWTNSFNCVSIYLFLHWI